MARKVFTDESLSTFVDEVKSYTDSAVSTKADSSHSHSISNVTNLQSSLDAKQATITGGATTITSSNLTASRALVSDGNGKVAVSAVTSTELDYLDGVTANVQTQLNSKANSSHTHNYAGSSSAGGAATSANKLNTDAGSATQPVYFDNGVPVATTYALNKTVPSDAKFTDTTYSVATQSANGLLSVEDKIQLDYGGIPIVATSGDGTAYTATVDGMTELKVGAKITIIPHVVSAAYAPTLNVNGLGAKAIRMPITYNTSASSNGVLTNWLVANKPVTVQYNGSYWLTVDLVRPSAQYLYGAVPMANGGTGATNGATGLANLFAAGNTVLSSYQYGDTFPSSASEGTMFFKKATGTVADIDTNLVSELMLTMYPVDSIYMSTSSTSPAELFGGTWTQLKDRFLLGAGSSYSNGATGGAATHTLIIDEMPPHRHSFKDGSHTFLWGDGVGTVNINGTQAVAAAASGNSLYTIQGAWASTNATGGGWAHNNMPPYLVVYMWKRTA